MSTETKGEVVTSTTDGDHDRFAHYIWADNPGAVLMQSYVTGIPVKALCGKRWVPSRDADKYPVCPDCKRIKTELQKGNE